MLLLLWFTLQKHVFAMAVSICSALASKFKNWKLLTTVNVPLRAMPCLAGRPTENSVSLVAAIHAYDERSPNLLATISAFSS